MIRTIDYLEQATEWADREIEDNATWKRKLTLELLHKEPESLIEISNNKEVI